MEKSCDNCNRKSDVKIWCGDKKGWVCPSCAAILYQQAYTEIVMLKDELKGARKETTMSNEHNTNIIEQQQEQIDELSQPCKSCSWQNTEEQLKTGICLNCDSRTKFGNYKSLQTEIVGLKDEIAELKERLKQRNQIIQEKSNELCKLIDIRNQLAEAKDTISRRNKQVKRTEERLQEVCPHEGESKNGVCLECERYL